MSSTTNPHEPSCQQIEALLDELVDGQLTEEQHDTVRQHLARCEGCGGRLATVEALLAQADALPRAIEPPADLWAEIGPRLTARSARQRRNPWAFGWRQAVAAVFFMSLGALLSQVAGPGWPGALSISTIRGATGPFVEAVERRADFALAEADYLRAKESLWSAVYSNREAVAPETREVVERNLLIIDRAIRELQLALQTDPGNRRLENLLLAQHRTEIDLLLRLARATEI